MSEKAGLGNYTYAGVVRTASGPLSGVNVNVFVTGKYQSAFHPKITWTLPQPTNWAGPTAANGTYSVLVQTPLSSENPNDPQDFGRLIEVDGAVTQVINPDGTPRTLILSGIGSLGGNPPPSPGTVNLSDTTVK